MLAKLARALETPLLLAVPATMGLCAWLHAESGALLTLLVVVTALLLMFANWEASQPALRQIMPTVVLASLAAAGRILFAPFPNFKPLLAICIIAGTVFEKRTGFMVGALAALLSNMFFGQGPWTPWQMYAWGLAGYLAGTFAELGAFGGKEPTKRMTAPHMATLLVFGFLCALLSGFILNSWYVVGYVVPLTLPGALAAYAAGLPFDIAHGVATASFLAALYLPWRRKLHRIKAKYNLR